LRVLYCSRSPRICAWGHPGGSPDDYRSRGPATRILEYLLKQLLPIPPVPATFARTEDFAPPIAASHSHPYPSKHALRSTILLGAVYLLGTSSLWRAAVALALLGLLASRVYLGTHWTSDVVGGALLGASAMLWVFGRED